MYQNLSEGCGTECVENADSTHYLYNTLDVIRMTALEENDETSAELLECLAHQLRYVMGEHTDCIVLQDELQHCVSTLSL